MSYGLTCRYVRADESGEPAGHCRHGMKYGRHGRPDCTDKAGNIPGRTGIHNRPEGRTGDAPAIGKRTRQRVGTSRVRYSSSRKQSTNFIPMEKLEHMSGFSAMYTVMGRLTSFSWRSPERQGDRTRGGNRNQVVVAVQRRRVKTMTTDNGSEFPTHRKITEAMKGSAVCFAAPTLRGR